MYGGGRYTVFNKLELNRNWWTALDVRKEANNTYRHQWRCYLKERVCVFYDRLEASGSGRDLVNPLYIAPLEEGTNYKTTCWQNNRANLVFKEETKRSDLRGN